MELRINSHLTLKAPPAGGLPARFSGVAYSGGLVPSYGVVIDTASTGAAAPLHLLHEHSRSNIIGVVENIAIADGRIVVAGKLFSDIAGSTAEQLAQLAQRGAPLQMSVGLFGYSEELIPLGTAATVNGQSVAGPVTVLRNGKVRECSLVTLGADPATKVKLFGGRQGLDPRVIYERRRREAAACRR